VEPAGISDKLVGIVLASYGIGGFGYKARSRLMQSHLPGQAGESLVKKPALQERVPGSRFCEFSPLNPLGRTFFVSRQRFPCGPGTHFVMIEAEIEFHAPGIKPLGGPNGLL
jgi:hypothetical protein